MIFYGICIFTLCQLCGGTTPRIVSTSILSFLPWCKLHQILAFEPENRSDIYLLDFSPINQKNPKTLLHLALGKRVPAEIRFRHFYKKKCDKDDEEIIDDWCRINDALSTIDSVRLSEKTFAEFQSDDSIDPDLKEIVHNARKWPSEMNLYTYNCRTFARKFIKKYESHKPLSKGFSVHGEKRISFDRISAHALDAWHTIFT